MQSKKRSLLEAAVITIIGISYAVPLNYAMINNMTWPNPWIQSLCMTIIFMLISIVFKYVMRRFFNWYDVTYPTAHIRTDSIISPDGNFKIDFANSRIEVKGEPGEPYREYAGDRDQPYPDGTYDEEATVCKCCGRYK